MSIKMGVTGGWVGKISKCAQRDTANWTNLIEAVLIAYT